MKLEIGKIFGMVLEQEMEIEKQKDKIPLHYNSLLNKIKNRNTGMDLDLA